MGVFVVLTPFLGGSPNFLSVTNLGTVVVIVVTIVIILAI
jgi:hypothetical protein